MFDTLNHIHIWQVSKITSVLIILKNWEKYDNRMKEIGFVTPTPDQDEVS